MQRLKRLLANLSLKLRSYLHTDIPIGLKAYNAWAADVVALSGVPDSASVRFALAVIVMHETLARPTLRAYAAKLRKGAVNEVAHAVAQQLKEEQKANEVKRIQEIAG